MKPGNDDLLGFAGTFERATGEFAGPTRAVVEETLPDGTVRVRTSLGTQFECGESAVREAETLRSGVVVIVLPPDGSGGTGIILAIVRDLRAGSEPGEDVREMQDSLVLEAREELILRVGDGSITIRKDGRILIKGQDLVSHATRLNRIKGGAVSIN
jgi:hypothetical protein